MKSDIDRLNKLLQDKTSELDKLTKELRAKTAECDDWKNKYNQL